MLRVGWVVLLLQVMSSVATHVSSWAGLGDPHSPCHRSGASAPWNVSASSASSPEHSRLFYNMAAGSKRIKQKLLDLLRVRPGAHTQHHFCFTVLVRVSHKPAQIQGRGK